MSEELTGKVVVVTGAARGLGASLARQLSARGARLALLGLEPDLLAEVSASCPGSAFWTVDVTDADALTRTAQAVVDTLGPADVLVANAGIASGGHSGPVGSTVGGQRFLESSEDAGEEDTWEPSPSDLSPALLGLVEQNGAEVVILDTAYKFFGGDVESSSSLMKGFEVLDKVIHETGCSFVLTHHHKKGQGGGGKQNTDIADPDNVAGSFLWTGWPNGSAARRSSPTTAAC